MVTSHRYSILRPLPPSISSSRAVSFLHEHSNIITLSPLVIEHHALPPSDESATDLTTYSITDRIEYLPFGLYTGNVTVTANFTNQDNGVTTTRHAPFGFTIKERWVVREGSSSSADQAVTKELVLNVELIANKLVLTLFKSMMEKNHEGYINGMTEIMLEDHGTDAT